jgi:hypothetical protein
VPAQGQVTVKVYLQKNTPSTVRPGCSLEANIPPPTGRFRKILVWEVAGVIVSWDRFLPVEAGGPARFMSLVGGGGYARNWPWALTPSHLMPFT